MPTIVGFLTCISMINTTSERLIARNFFICRYFGFYEQLRFHIQLSWAWKKFYNLWAWTSQHTYTHCLLTYTEELESSKVCYYTVRNWITLTPIRLCGCVVFTFTCLDRMWLIHVVNLYRPRSDYSSGQGLHYLQFWPFLHWNFNTLLFTLWIWDFFKNMVRFFAVSIKFLWHIIVFILILSHFLRPTCLLFMMYRHTILP